MGYKVRESYTTRLELVTEMIFQNYHIAIKPAFIFEQQTEINKGNDKMFLNIENIFEPEDLDGYKEIKFI